MKFSHKSPLFFISIIIVVVLHFISESYAITGINLNGTWMLDMKATEDFILSSPPKQETVDFLLMNASVSHSVWEFDDDILYGGMWTVLGPQMLEELKLLNRNENEIVYIPTTGTAKSKTGIIMVEILDNNSIKIIGEKMIYGVYYIWKPVGKLEKRSQTKKERDEANKRTVEWVTILDNVNKTLKGSKSLISSVEKEKKLCSVNPGQIEEISQYFQILNIKTNNIYH